LIKKEKESECRKKFSSSRKFSPRSSGSCSSHSKKNLGVVSSLLFSEILMKKKISSQNPENFPLLSAKLVRFK